MGVVVLTEVICNSFNILRMWWSWKKRYLTVSIFVGCGRPERRDFLQFLHLVSVVVLRELIFNSFYFLWVWWSWKMWWSWKKWFLTVSTFGRMWWSWKKRFLTVSALGGCGGLKEEIFNSFYIWRMWLSEISDFYLFQHCEDVVVLKEVIFNIFYFWWAWWYWQKWFLTVSTYLGCGGLERRDI